MSEKPPRKKRKDAGKPRVQNPLGVTKVPKPNEPPAAARPKGRVVPEQPTNGEVVTDETTKRRARKALEAKHENPYPNAKGKVYLRVVLQVLDDAKQILDVAHRTYEHPPEIAKQQFEAIKVALFHNKQEGVEGDLEV